MPEPKQILPMLEGFLTGDPISDHHGVSCSPAMREATEEKYMLKTVSVPASGAKLEAMLLAGAFSDRAAALAYYEDMSQAIVEEAVLLQRLSRLEGFTPYEAWQSQPKEDGSGYCVSLLSPYRPTLERCLKTKPMTQLEAVNLGLDLCAALAVCRRSGYLYVDLKPSNIFICDDREFRIGDLGFIALSSLPYASLPEKYHSEYTAPEITDAYSSLNGTLDIYAAGLILYQVYNNGILPQEGSDPLLPPEYADYEMAAIILKACDSDPENRWQSPAQMGQALVAYMQKNTVNDTPIIPPAIPVEPEPEVEDIPTEPDTDEPTTDEVLSEVDQALESVGVDPQAAEAALAEAVEAAEETPAEPAEEAAPEPETDAQELQEDRPEAEEAPEEPASTEEIPEEPEELAEPEQPEEETEPAAQEPVDEITQMLAQADDLIAHETPEGVVAPEPIDVPIPPPIVLPAEEEPQEEIPEEAASEPQEEPSSEEAPEAEPEEEEPAEEPASEEAPVKAHRGRGLIAAAICLVIAVGLAFGGYFYYNHEYLQHVEGITLTGDEDSLTVSLSTDIDDSLLTVVCTDSYGNTKRQNVTNKSAVFTDLNPDTRYKVQVEIYGFHKLTGNTSGIHITQKQTSILNFSAVAGGESGSAILSFTVQGPETNEWKLTYFAEGEEEKSITFTGHVVSVNGLTLGKTYSFLLEPSEPLYIVGTDTLEFTASNLIYAENLTIQSFSGNALTAVWTAPEGETVDGWIVRCYNDAGFDKTLTVTETKAVFADLDPAYAYAVEVSAVGMSQGSRVSVSANALTVKDLVADTSDPARLKLSWSFEGKAPEGGWLVQYTVSGISEPLVIQCAEPYAEILPMIPGSTYTVTIQAAGGNTVFGGSISCTAPEATTFSGFGISAQYMKFSMCRTPDQTDWDRYDVNDSDYTTQFAIGESASFTVRLNHEYDTSPTQIVTLYLIRDASGNVVSSNTTAQTWTSMWYKGHGKLTIPAMPTVPGSYTVEILFNGQHVTTESFTVS